MIAEEMEMDKDVRARTLHPAAPCTSARLTPPRFARAQLAERKLREHNGDVVATLTSLVRA